MNLNLVITAHLDCLVSTNGNVPKDTVYDPKSLGLRYC